VVLIVFEATFVMVVDFLGFLGLECSVFVHWVSEKVYFIITLSFICVVPLLGRLQTNH